MVDTELAYIAGIIDGEGTISVGIRNPNPKMRELRPQLVLQVAVVMTDESIISWLKQVTGIGNLYKQIKTNPKHKNIFHWRPSIKDSAKLLIQILPYLIVKKRQAELFIELVSIRSISTRNTVNRERQFEIVSEIQKLNKRGK